MAADIFSLGVVLVEIYNGLTDDGRPRRPYYHDQANPSQAWDEACIRNSFHYHTLPHQLKVPRATQSWGSAKGTHWKGGMHTAFVGHPGL